jgi:hypothetical protein
MNDDTRSEYVEFLTAEAGFDEESLDGMDDDALEQTYSLAAEASAAGGDDPDDDPEDDDDPGAADQPLAEMTLADLAEGLKQQGFVTEDNASDLVQEAQAQASKAERVDEIIAKSTDYDEDDREALLASADKVVEREHQRVRSAGAAGLPGTAGAATSLTASTGGEDSPDAYGTGVQGDAE